MVRFRPSGSKTFSLFFSAGFIALVAACGTTPLPSADCLTDGGPSSGECSPTSAAPAGPSNGGAPLDGGSTLDAGADLAADTGGGVDVPSATPDSGGSGPGLGDVLECTPECSELECGPDGCGGTCGDCGRSGTCVDGLCFEDQEAGLSCSELVDCLFECDDEDCPNDCVAASTPEARNLYGLAIACIEEYCLEVFDEEEFAECQSERCTPELSACFATD